MSAAAGQTVHPAPISLSVGEPRELPPDEVIEAAVRALREGRTRYGPPAGLPELREALAAAHVARTGIATGIEQVLVTAGGKPAIESALRCVLEPGDEVLVLAPYWPTFLEQVRWCGAHPVVVPFGAGLSPDPHAVARACTARTRALILNTPCNPTGRVHDRALIAALGELAEARDLWLVSDEVYRELCLVGPAPEPLSVNPALAERTVVVESFSKRFSMTGYRLGAAIGPPRLIEAMTRLAASSVTHPCTVSQWAGLAALELDGSWERERLERHRQLRDRALAGLRGLPGLEVAQSEAGLYLFPQASSWIAAAKVPDDVALCARLREECGLLLVPGSAFGAPGHLRLSWCVDDDRLEEGLSRLTSWASKHL